MSSIYKVSLTVDTLDATSPVEAVDMFLNIISSIEPLHFVVEDGDGAVVLVSSDDVKREYPDE